MPARRSAAPARGAGKLSAASPARARSITACPSSPSRHANAQTRQAGPPESSEPSASAAAWTAVSSAPGTSRAKRRPPARQAVPALRSSARRRPAATDSQSSVAGCEAVAAVDVVELGYLDEHQAERTGLHRGAASLGLHGLVEVAAGMQQCQVVHHGEGRGSQRAGAVGVPVGRQLVLDGRFVPGGQGVVADLLDEQAHDPGVELRAGAAFELGARLLGREALAVRAVGDHRAERVGHPDDARLERDALALQPGGVARPVEALVVMQDGWCDGSEGRDAHDDPVPDARVQLDDVELVAGQWPRLEQNALGDADLARSACARTAPWPRWRRRASGSSRGRPSAARRAGASCPGRRPRGRPATAARRPGSRRSRRRGWRTRAPRRTRRGCRWAGLRGSRSRRRRPWRPRRRGRREASRRVPGSGSRGAARGLSAPGRARS